MWLSERKMNSSPSLSWVVLFSPHSYEWICSHRFSLCDVVFRKENEFLNISVWVVLFSPHSQEWICSHRYSQFDVWLSERKVNSSPSLSWVVLFSPHRYKWMCSPRFSQSDMVVRKESEFLNISVRVVLFSPLSQEWICSHRCSQFDVVVGQENEFPALSVDVSCALLHSFFFPCSCVFFCLYGPFNCISFYKILPTNLRFLTLFIRSYFCLSDPFTSLYIYISIKSSFSPDVILCGWLGWKHQLTN